MAVVHFGQHRIVRHTMRHTVQHRTCPVLPVSRCTLPLVRGKPLRPQTLPLGIPKKENIVSMSRARNNDVHVYLTQAEKEKLKKAADKCNASQSLYIRLLIKGVSPREAPPVVFQDFHREMLEISSALTEIASFASMTGWIEDEQYRKVVKILWQVLEEILSAVYDSDKVDQKKIQKLIDELPEPLCTQYIREGILDPPEKEEVEI